MGRSSPSTAWVVHSTLWIRNPCLTSRLHFVSEVERNVHGSDNCDRERVIVFRFISWSCRKATKAMQQTKETESQSNSEIHSYRSTYSLRVKQEIYRRCEEMAGGGTEYCQLQYFWDRRIGSFFSLFASSPLKPPTCFCSLPTPLSSFLSVALCAHYS